MHRPRLQFIIRHRPREASNTEAITNRGAAAGMIIAPIATGRSTRIPEPIAAMMGKTISALPID